MGSNNPLSGYFRAPKLYTRIPSLGKFYDDSVLDMPASGELPVFPMTAKDETLMKNPDALLNGEAVAQVIASCVPNVKKPRRLLNGDVEALLVAIQGATFGDDIDIKSKCPSCTSEVTGVASIEAALETMAILEDVYKFDTDSGLTIEIKPYSYESTIKAGIANFQSTRSLQSISNISDELEQLKAFNDNFVKIAALNFELIVDSVASISGVDSEGRPFKVTDYNMIKEFLENCEVSIGKAIENKINDINRVGINKKIGLECDNCHHQFEQEVGFDPVNFFTAS